jgi:hypothetical protein
VQTAAAPRHLENVLRFALDALASGSLARRDWDALDCTLRRLTRRATSEDGEDLRQAFLVSLLDHPARLDALRALPPGSLWPAFRRAFRRFAFESVRAGPAGRLLKALDEVIRRRPQLFRIVGRAVRLVPGAVAPGWPTTLFRGETDRLDHDALARALATLLAAEPGPRPRPELARRLVEAYRLGDLASAPVEPAEGLVDRLALERSAAEVAAALDLREQLVLEDVLDGLPLRETAPRVGLGLTAVHATRRRLGRRLDESLARHGFDAAARVALLDTLERRLRAHARGAAARAA